MGGVVGADRPASPDEGRRAVLGALLEAGEVDAALGDEVRDAIELRPLVRLLPGVQVQGENGEGRECLVSLQKTPSLTTFDDFFFACTTTIFSGLTVSLPVRAFRFFFPVIAIESSFFNRSDPSRAGDSE